MNRRNFALTAVVAVAVCTLFIGFQLKIKPKNSAPLPVGAAPNEVLTLTPVKQDKTLITIRAEYDIDYDFMEAALEEKFPDIDVVFVLHWTGDTPYELRQSLAGGGAEDILLSAFMPAVRDLAPKYLIDFSARDFTAYYQRSALNNCQIDGHLYYLPGPSDIIGIIYNRTMFAQHGWKLPKGRSKFLQLCKTINAAGLRALQPTCKNPPDVQLLFTSFVYKELFAGLDNYKWLTDYQLGRVPMKGHMEPAFQFFSQLKDAGIVLPSDFEIRRANRSQMEYIDEKCAMIIETQMAQKYAKLFKSHSEFAMMPFWNGDEADSDYLVTRQNYFIGVNAGLKRPDQAKKLARVMDVIAWLSTPQGQRSLVGGTMTMLPSVRKLPTEFGDFNAEVRATIEKENFAPYVNFMTSGVNNPVQLKLGEELKMYLDGQKNSDTLMQDCDSVRDKVLRHGIERGAVLGKAGENFTKLETGLFIADTFKKKTGADIGLSLVGKINYGTVARLYKGDVTEKDIAMLTLMLERKPQYSDDKKLGVVEMTGAQIMDLLKKPFTEKNPESFRNVPYFVASGLKIVFAPWAPDDRKLKTVTLADGSALIMDKSYTVALWYWPFDNRCPYRTVKIFDDSSEQIFAEAVKAVGTIEPIRDGRFTLNWNR